MEGILDVTWGNLLDGEVARLGLLGNSIDNQRLRRSGDVAGGLIKGELEKEKQLKDSPGIAAR